MMAALNGDYSKYPEVIKEPLSYVAGETCELRQAWSVYHRLFMADKRLTAIMRQGLGPLLGLFQNDLQDIMFLSIYRLTDKGSQIQPSLSIWTLRAALPFATDPEFPGKVDTALAAIWDAAANVRKHRHKRIAHFDRAVSLRVAPLPVVKFTEIRALLEMIEGYVNLFFWEFEQTTMRFDVLPGYDITGVAEVTTLKAHAYDILERDKTIAHGEWRKHWKAYVGDADPEP